MDQSSVALSILFSDQNLILDMEVRDIILKVYILRNDEGTNTIIVDLGYETIVG